jgi:hypothetical protein
MSEETWSIIKFKVKEAHHAEFISSVHKYIDAALEQNLVQSMRLINVSDNEFAAVVQYANIADTIEIQSLGLEWLDSVTHMLDLYGEDRTSAFSGLVI